MKNKSKHFNSIIVCGDVGTGTTTLSEGLAKRLGWRHISAGNFFREYTKKHNIPLWDKLSVPDEVDKKIDYEILEKMEGEKDIVLDSHYGGWFAKDLNDVLRILLVCDKDVAAQRILDRDHTHKETPEDIEKRRQGLRAKFKKLYSPNDYEDPKYFHLVIDTTNIGIDQTLSTTYNRLLASS